MADRGAGTQIYVVPAAGGDPKQVTAWPGGLLSYEWSPDSKQMALHLVDAPDPKFAERKQQFGDFTIVGEDKYTAQLWLLDVEAAIAAGGVSPGPSEILRPLTSGAGFSVTMFSVEGLRSTFSFSPDGKQIVFSFGESMGIMDSARSDIGIVDVESGKFSRLTNTENWDEVPAFSPDGEFRFVFSNDLPDFVADKKLMIIPSRGGNAKPLEIQYGDGIDRSPLFLGWGVSGIDVFFLNGTKQHAHRINSKPAR